MDFKSAVEISEKILKRDVVRGGKKKTIKKTDRKGYTIKGGKEVKMSPDMIRKQKIAAKKRSKTMKSKSKSTSTQKRKRSMQKRKSGTYRKDYQ